MTASCLEYFVPWWWKPILHFKREYEHHHENTTVRYKTLFGVTIVIGFEIRGDVKAELISQWESNHFEHCGNDLKGLACPKGDGCHWPIPDALARLI